MRDINQPLTEGTGTVREYLETVDSLQIPDDDKKVLRDNLMNGSITAALGTARAINRTWSLQQLENFYREFAEGD